MTRDTATPHDLEMVGKLAAARTAVFSEMEKVIIGQERVLEDILVTLLSRGHALLVGVPGLAKTLMISTMASILDLRFSRIQFTPDLMPSDITGTDILQEDPVTRRRSFSFINGPIFGNVILADEINRTPPKTQAALLEAMQEHRVTAAGHTYTLAEPFFVLATQNPIEQEGTYPLPEAQLDRFMFNLWLDYPSADEELQIVRWTTSREAPRLRHVLTGAQIIGFQDLVRRVPVADNVIAYAVKLARRTRPKGDQAPEFIRNWLSWGAGPRASQYLILGAKTRALLDGRHTPEIDDVRSVAPSALRHRIVPNFNAEADGVTAIEIVTRLVAETPA